MKDKEIENYSLDQQSLIKSIRKLLIERQIKIDESITDNAEIINLVDKPCVDDTVIRVSGPFTVESLAPLRSISGSGCRPKNFPIDYFEDVKAPKSETNNQTKFIEIIRNALLHSTINNTVDMTKLNFDAVEYWSESELIDFIGYYNDGVDKKAAICVGPEFGSVSKNHIVSAAQDANQYFDILLYLGFAFDPLATDLLDVARGIRTLKVRLHNDLHIAELLKESDKSQLFVIIGEPDISVTSEENSKLSVEIKGMEVFDPASGNVKSCKSEDIACWLLDTNYNGEIFIPSDIYFCKGIKDPLVDLKKILQGEISENIWQEVYSTKSRPFIIPTTGQIAVKAINKYCVETLKVIQVKQEK